MVRFFLLSGCFLFLWFHISFFFPSFNYIWFFSLFFFFFFGESVALQIQITPSWLIFTTNTRIKVTSFSLLLLFPHLQYVYCFPLPFLVPNASFYFNFFIFFYQTNSSFLISPDRELILMLINFFLYCFSDLNFFFICILCCYLMFLTLYLS